MISYILPKIFSLIQFPQHTFEYHSFPFPVPRVASLEKS